MGRVAIPMRRATDFAPPAPSPMPPAAVLEFPPPAVEKTPGLATRIGAFAVLMALVMGIVVIGRQVYLAVTDAFVAPMILSPDNDLVLAHKQKVLELESERSRANALLEGVEANISAIQEAELQLARLETLASSSMQWTSAMSTRQVWDGSTDITTLETQRALLEEMRQQQRQTTDRALTNFQSSLITRRDLEKEQQALRQAELSLLENARALARARTSIAQAALGRLSLIHI